MQKALIITVDTLAVELLKSTELISSRYSLVRCRHYTDDLLQPAQSVWAPNPTAQITMKSVKRKFTLNANARLN